MMHFALQGAPRQMWTVRGTAMKRGVRSEMFERISFTKYGIPRRNLRGKEEIFMGGMVAIQKCATTSISTLAPFGSAATWTVERAGKSLVKYFE